MAMLMIVGADFMAFTLCPSPIEKAGFMTFFCKVIQKILHSSKKISVAVLNIKENASLFCSVEGDRLPL